MTTKYNMTVAEVARRARDLADRLPIRPASVDGAEPVRLYGVPRGGVPVALAVASESKLFQVVDSPTSADIIVDDIIDSGCTQARYALHYPEKPFVALVNKKDNADDARLGWVVFPWEAEEDADNSIVGTIRNRLTSRRNSTREGFGPADSVASAIMDGDREAWHAEVERRTQHLLEGLLLDTETPHLKETAARVSRMYIKAVCRGRYEPCPDATVFQNTHVIQDPQVIGPITLRSLCAHHFCPIMGNLWVAYRPGKDKLIGLSKFHRLSDWVASRPQVQEELTCQVADLLQKQIEPRSLLIYVKASHTCVSWRGVRDHPEGAMVSVAFRGQTEDRAELLSLVQQQPV